jgi:hypothetical protein|tara:strand:- start:10576 stop:10752 length:177 start_codon:yes stop_codon:yes gene_type:complete
MCPLAGPFHPQKAGTGAHEIPSILSRATTAGFGLLAVFCTTLASPWHHLAMIVICENP